MSRSPGVSPVLAEQSGQQVDIVVDGEIAALFRSASEPGAASPIPGELPQVAHFSSAISVEASNARQLDDYFRGEVYSIFRDVTEAGAAVELRDPPASSPAAL